MLNKMEINADKEDDNNSDNDDDSTSDLKYLVRCYLRTKRT